METDFPFQVWNLPANKTAGDLQHTGKVTSWEVHRKTCLPADKKSDGKPSPSSAIMAEKL